MNKLKKFFVKSMCASLLVCSVAVVGNYVQAANQKVVRNKLSNYGSLIDQTSICDEGNGAGSQTVYRCTNNGSNKTKFVFNVMSYNNKTLKRYAAGYLRVGKSEGRYNNSSKTSDFGDKIVVSTKGPGEIGSYIEEYIRC